MPAPSAPRRRAARRVAASLASLLVALALPAAASASSPGSVGVPTMQPRPDGVPAPVIERGTYDYAPSVMWDAQAGVYRMWWCGGVSGDHVLYAVSRKLDGPYMSATDDTPNSYDVALAPSPDPYAFDHTHVCDPSVIKVDGTWYLYYGGANEDEPGAPTRIGLATSTDGVTWTRANGGRPIVVPARDVATVVNGYGAGQPSVTHVGGRFHLVFTDTTGRGGNQGNGAGQYVMRSADPLFSTGVEELQSYGWATYYRHRHTRHSLLEAFSTDWQYSRALNAFVLSESRTNRDRSRTVRVHFYAPDLLSELPGSPVVLPADWSEGTALVGGPNRRLALPTAGVQRLEVVRPLGDADPFTWRLFPVTAHVPVTRPSV